MPACTNGAELVKKLAASGTGESKLKVARDHLEKVHRAEKRVADSAELVEAMAAAGVPEGTLEKARAIAETGEWVGPQSVAPVPIEELLLAGGDPGDATPGKKKPAPDFTPAVVGPLKVTTPKDDGKDDGKPAGGQPAEHGGEKPAPPVGPAKVSPKAK